MRPPLPSEHPCIPLEGLFISKMLWARRKILLNIREKSLKVFSFFGFHFVFVFDEEPYWSHTPPTPSPLLVSMKTLGICSAQDALDKTTTLGVNDQPLGLQYWWMAEEMKPRWHFQGEFVNHRYEHDQHSVAVHKINTNNPYLNTLIRGRGWLHQTLGGERPKATCSGRACYWLALQRH